MNNKSIELTTIQDIYENKEKYLGKKIRVSGWGDKKGNGNRIFTVDLRFDFERNENTLILPLILDKESIMAKNDFIGNPYFNGVEGELVVGKNEPLELKVKWIDTINCGLKGWVEEGYFLIKRIKPEIIKEYTTLESWVN